MFIEIIYIFEIEKQFRLPAKSGENRFGKNSLFESLWSCSLYHSCSHMNYFTFFFLWSISLVYWSMIYWTGHSGRHESTEHLLTNVGFAEAASPGQCILFHFSRQTRMLVVGGGGLTKKSTAPSMRRLSAVEYRHNISSELIHVVEYRENEPTVFEDSWSWSHSNYFC